MVDIPELDLNLLLTAFGAVVGWVFAALEFFVGRRDRKKDSEKHERELKEQRREFQVQVERPDPVIELSCETHNAGGKKYLLSTICVNNVGKDVLEIDGAVYLVERARTLPNDEFNFSEINAERARKLLGLGAEVTLEKCQKEFCKEITHVDILEEYLCENDISVGHNENLRCHRLSLIREPGFCRATVFFHPTHEDLNYDYWRSHIVYVRA